MTTYEQTDGFVPNKQTPPSTSKVGASDAKFSEVHGTTVSGTTIGAGSNLYVAGRDVPGKYSESADLSATASTITHGLNNSNPVIQVYGSGMNQLYPLGSGAPGDIYVAGASGTSANAVQVTMSAAAPASIVVVIG